MTRKGRKSILLWRECENCSCIINSRDSELHLNNCPPKEDNWDHSFIKDKTLFSYYDDVDVKVIPSWISSEMVEDIIFLSQSVMQICGFIIGFPVLLKLSGKKAIKKVWPTTEGSLTSILLSKEALEVCLDIKSTSNLIKISNLDRAPKTVDEVHYRIANLDEENFNFEEFSIILRNRLEDKVFCSGNRFHVPFYGKKVLIQINKCTCNASSDIINEVDCLSLDDLVYVANESTNFICSNRRKLDMAVPVAVKFGGYESIITELQQCMHLALQENSSLGPHCLGILLYGVHGVGKTLAMNYLCSFYQVHVVSIKGMEMFSKYYGETEGKLRDLFKEAISNTPCIILVDNVETLCPRKGSDLERRVTSALLSLFDVIQHRRIVVLATSSNPDNIESSLRRPGRLELEIELPVPSIEDRKAILSALLPETKLKENLDKIAELSHGFVGADLAAILAKAQSRAATFGASDISANDLFWAHSHVVPSAMREVYVQVPNVRWGDVAGQEELKLKLKQCVEWPIKHPESFSRLGIKPPRGVLLYGPPGCSKTMIAKAIATESQLNFITIKGSDIFSKWVGESERAVRDVFKRARSVAPCIVFIDEVDALGGERESGSVSGGSAVQERVLSQLLTEMDGVAPLENVVVIAATNRPDRIDKALLRPGRLDRIIYVPLPNFDTRKHLFELLLKKIPVDSSVNAETMATTTDGYSGAEIVALCNEAALKALEETIDADMVKANHFAAAICIITPRTPSKLLKLYSDYAEKRGGFMD